MNSLENSPAANLYRFAARPAYLIKVICQMLVGLGIAIGLIAKVYMFVLTDYQCVADMNTLGNRIRCGKTLAIMAYALALSGGFELAYRMFKEGINGAIDPLIIGVCSVFLLILSSLSLDNASWQIAMLLASLTLSVAALLFCRERLNAQPPSHGAGHSTGHSTGRDSTVYNQNHSPADDNRPGNF